MIAHAYNIWLISALIICRGYIYYNILQCNSNSILQCNMELPYFIVIWHTIWYTIFDVKKKIKT
jgi:hypothetical protein